MMDLTETTTTTTEIIRGGKIARVCFLQNGFLVIRQIRNIEFERVFFLFFLELFNMMFKAHE